MNGRTLSITLIALCSAFAGSANAECGSSKAARQALLMPVQGSLEERTLLAPEVSANFSKPDPDTSIVGFWDVKFFSGGQLVDEGFDQFHGDGMEILYDFPPFPNVCLGVWVKTGVRNYKLRHPFWVLDPTGNLIIGRGELQAKLTMKDDGDSYTGTFTFQYRDLLDRNKPLPEHPDVSGHLTAKRITAD
jgi:hypothetical protein